MEILEIAKQAYAAYAAYALTTDNKNFMSDELPKFEDLPENIQQAWCSSCATVLHMKLVNERIDLQGQTVTIPAESLLSQKDNVENIICHLKEFSKLLRKKVERLGEEIPNASNEKNEAYLTGLKDAHIADWVEIKYILRLSVGKDKSEEFNECVGYSGPIGTKGYTFKTVEEAQEGEYIGVGIFINHTIEVGNKVKIIKDLSDSGGLVKVSYRKDAHKPLEIGDIGYVDSASYAETDGYITVSFIGCDISIPLTHWKEFLDIIP